MTLDSDDDAISSFLPGFVKVGSYNNMINKICSQLVACHPRELFAPIISILPVLMDVPKSCIQTLIISTLFHTIIDLPALASVVHSFHSLNLSVVCCPSIGDPKSQPGREPRTSLGQELHACKFGRSGDVTCLCQCARSLANYCFQHDCQPPGQSKFQRFNNLFVFSVEHPECRQLLLQLSGYIFMDQWDGCSNNKKSRP